MAEDRDLGEMSRIRILCVDDEPGILQALTRVFIDQEYRIFTALSGKEGLLLLEKGLEAKIVIADYRMQEMNGVDFLRQVCLQWPDTVRIILSGHADVSGVVKAVNEGQIYKFIFKPWDDDELRVAVANAVDKYFLQQENMRLTEELLRKNKQLECANSRLGRIVAENASHLAFQNSIFRASHSILSALPWAVIGLNGSREIAVCNKKGARLLGVNEIEVIGRDSRKVFTKQMSAFVAEVLEKGKASRVLTLGGADVKTRGFVAGSGEDNYVSLLIGEEN